MGDLGLIALPAFAFDEFDAAIEVAGNDVPVMEEGIFFEADVDKGGLEAIFEIANFAFENAADEPLLGGAFDIEFFEFAFLEDRNAGLESFGIDDNFLVNFLHRLDETLDFLYESAGGDADAIDEALGLALQLDRGEWLFLDHFRRRFQVRLAEAGFFGRPFRLRLFGQSFRRQAGRDIFRRLVEAREQVAAQDRKTRVVILGQPLLHRGALVGHRHHPERHQRHAGQQHSAQEPDEGAAEVQQL